MQDEMMPDPGCTLDEAERAVLYLLLRPAPTGLFSTQEIAREIGAPITAGIAIAGLHAAGLAHRLEEFVFATRAAARFHELSAPVAD